VGDIVAAVRRAVPAHLPVSAKMRLGFNDDLQAEECAIAIAEAGASELVIHARTKADGYRPPAYWPRIADIRSVVNIPIVANGEIWTVEDALRCQAESGCTSVMIGRGMVANPGLALAIAATGPNPLGANSVSWAQINPLLWVYWELVCLRVEGRHRAGRIKQWLNFLRRCYPEGEETYQALRTLNDSREVEAWLKAHCQAAPA